MISLISLKAHMMRVKTTSLANLCSLFGQDADSMRCLLSHWVRKGKITRCANNPGCGTKCFKCPVVSTEWYAWAE